MRGIVSDWAPVLVLVAALAASWVTRRNATDTSALSGFTALATELRAELTEAKNETKETKARVTALENEELRKAALARIHNRWDEWMVQEMRNINPDSTIPDPPPLD